MAGERLLLAHRDLASRIHGRNAPKSGQTGTDVNDPNRTSGNVACDLKVVFTRRYRSPTIKEGPSPHASSGDKVAIMGAIIREGRTSRDSQPGLCARDHSCVCAIY